MLHIYCTASFSFVFSVCTVTLPPQVRQPPSKEQLASLNSRRKREMEEYQRGKVPH